MVSRRSSGIVLHPTSLPGPLGIGDLGAEARRFVDYIASAGQTLWQVLPLGPTGFGDSPYQCFSALAGNPLLISLEDLSPVVPAAPSFSTDRVNFEQVIPWKMAALEAAARQFREGSLERDRRRFEEFCDKNAAWLDDFALFMALKGRDPSRVWTQWEEDIRARDPGAMARWRERLADAIAAQKFLQYAFFSQWGALRSYCRERGVRMMGDLPIYVAHDSVDVWVNPQSFQLDKAGLPAAVAGVPPDYFSATGQLWGNPLYAWDALTRDGYSWWLDRFRAALKLVDVVRLDHFRGFEAYWEIPAGAATAQSGRWVKGPGIGLFHTLREALGPLPVVAENLGVITPEVESLRAEFGFPGMSILQFAFGTDPQASSFRPHNYSREMVAYTGTHDNDTTIGWWTSGGYGESTRSAEGIRAEREYARRYLNTDGRRIHWDFIRALQASVADTVLIPLQDVLGLGSEARMNQPATLTGNWRWRYRAEMLTIETARQLRALTELYERFDDRPAM
jgi:4-alpha-glucanotransferase